VPALKIPYTVLKFNMLYRKNYYLQNRSFSGISGFCPLLGRFIAEREHLKQALPIAQFAQWQQNCISLWKLFTLKL
jgi:hypothetical protein